MQKNNDNPSLCITNVESNISNESVAEKEAEGFDSLVNITVTSYRKRNHDPDGISIKAVLDGIVRRGILRDDSTKEVNKITFKSLISKEEKTVITIEEAND